MRNQYVNCKILEIRKLNDSVKSFVIDHSFSAKPGQFVMVWIPGVDEKPFSLSSKNVITVRSVGEFTSKMFGLQVGDSISVRGPYGNGFPSSKGVAIGGGCGIAPLSFFVSEGYDLQGFVLAGKKKDELIFIDEIEKKVESVVGITEDGSFGFKGLATDADYPKGENYFLCGPEIMMKFVAEKLLKEGVDPSRIYLSLERYMKCAIGVCGSCSFSGYRVCADGPVFKYSQIKDLPHFNTMKRNRTGELVNDRPSCPP